MSFVRDDHAWTRGVGAIAATDQTSSRRRIAAGRAGRMMAARDSVMARHALGRISTVDDPGRPQPEAPIFNTPGRPPKPDPSPPTATPPPAGSTPSAPPMPSGPLPAAGQCSADGKVIWDAAGYWRRLRVGEVCATTGTATVDTRVRAPSSTGWCVDAAGKITARPSGKVCPIGTAPSAPPDRRQPNALPPAAPTASAPPSTQPKPPVIAAGGGTVASGPAAAPSDTPPTEPLPQLPDEAPQAPGSAPNSKMLVYAAIGVGALWLLSRK